jgi:hypothetical protein
MKNYTRIVPRVSNHYLSRKEFKTISTLPEFLENIKTNLINTPKEMK